MKLTGAAGALGNRIKGNVIQFSVFRWYNTVFQAVQVVKLQNLGLPERLWNGHKTNSSHN